MLFYFYLTTAAAAAARAAAATAATEREAAAIAVVEREAAATRERSQKFVRRARRYIMGYHVLHQMQHNDVQGNRMTSSSKDLAIVPVKLEQMVKKFKTHRCALDFDYSFCKEVFKEAASAS